MFSSIFPIGGVCGPIFGGIITQYWDWRGIFFVNLPVGIALIALIWRFVPSTARLSAEKDRRPRHRIARRDADIGMLTVTTLGEVGSTPISAPVLVPAACAVLFGYLFFHHINRNASPIIPPRLIKGKGFAVMNLLNVLFGGAGFGFGVLIPLYAENRYHIASSSAGTVLSARRSA